MQANSPRDAVLPYVVMRGSRPPRPWYKRRIPPILRPILGAATLTVRLDGQPQGDLSERRRFLASYTRVHQQAETQLQQAQQQKRALSPIEQLGVAGSWATHAPAQPIDDTGATEAAEILQALESLGIVLPDPIPPDWAPGPLSASANTISETVLELGRGLQGLEHPGLAPLAPDHWIWGEVEPEPAAALRWLAEVVQAAAPSISNWQEQAGRELLRLGVIVGTEQRQQVAHRLTLAAVALSRQQAQIKGGVMPAPLTFPPPPKASGSGVTVDMAVERWAALRSPTAKTQEDARRRLKELGDHAGTVQLDAITAEQVAEWRASLLEGLSVATVKRRLALVRAVLQTAAADGLPVVPGVLDRLGTTTLRASSGTTRQRRPFTLEEARRLWAVSRKQQGQRPLDRWALPLGLATGARLEELAGLRGQDVRQIDGIWSVVIEPSEHRRLKNSSSARIVPIADALLREGFISWAQQQGTGLLFPEPTPPATDPRLSHYASIRLGKLIRGQAGISDPTAVFHSARHFAAQSLVDAGAEQRMIEQLLGHSSRSMTARYSRGGIPLAQLAAAMDRRDWSWVPGGADQHGIE